jgi:hypothetical protein
MLGSSKDMTDAPKYQASSGSSDVFGQVLHPEGGQVVNR